MSSCFDVQLNITYIQWKAKTDFKVYINLSFHNYKASVSIESGVYSPRMSWKRFAWKRVAETKANRRPEESSAGTQSLSCANLPVLTSCQNPASQPQSVLPFQTPDRQVISVKQPGPDIQVAWKLVSEAVGFSRCPMLVFVVWEQSEDEQFIRVLLFSCWSSVCLFCCFWTPVYSRLGLVLKILWFSTEYLNSVRFKSEYWALKWLSWICLCFFMQLARKSMSCKISSYCVTIYTHALDSNFIHRPWHRSNTTTPKTTFTV